jgi:glycosyltransferase involved in cell wall biosynthesis
MGRKAVDALSSPRKQLLLVAPVEPAETGNGLAMRLGAIFRALAERFDVHLFIVPLFPSPGARAEFTGRYSVRVGRLDLSAHIDPHYRLIASLKDRGARQHAMLQYPKPALSRFITSKTAETIRAWYGTESPDAVHVARSYLAPLAAAFQNPDAGSAPFSVLDVDEDEVQTRQRLAKLYSTYGDATAAAMETSEAEKYSDWEELYLATYDCVLLSSGDEAENMSERWPDLWFEVVPNAMAGRVPRQRRKRMPGLSRLLFVGNLSYPPNEDAVLFMVEAVLPRLQKISGRRAVLDIVGGGAGPVLRRLRARHDVVFHGYVKDLESIYRRADASVIPIRAGGGTRLKILEAFQYGTPVVSTSVGAEGLDVVNGRHLLIADKAADFASQCAMILRNRRLTDHLRSQGGSLLRNRYGLSRVKSRLDVVYGKIL